MAARCGLVRQIDFLVFPPKSLYLQILSTQTVAGGWGAYDPLVVQAIVTHEASANHLRSDSSDTPNYGGDIRRDLGPK